jgi:hypothetical protein
MPIWIKVWITICAMALVGLCAIYGVAGDSNTSQLYPLFLVCMAVLWGTVIAAIVAAIAVMWLS